jgi:hypothetical protein
MGPNEAANKSPARCLQYCMAIMMNAMDSVKGRHHMDTKVDVLVYSKVMDKFEIELIGVLEGMGPALHIDICHNLEDVSARLRMPHYHSTILVLVAADGEDLMNILFLQPIFDGVRIVLVLPDRNIVTATIGHGLRPRFVAYKDNGFQDVSDVLAKMTGSETARNP